MGRPRSLVRAGAQGLLGSALVFTGTGHLSFARQTFQAQVPSWFPLEPDLVVVLSGVAELALGAGLLTTLAGSARLLRRQVGWATAAFFVAIFPGNIAQYVEARDAFGLDSDGARLLRLFFQPLLVLWALWSTGAWPRRTGENPDGAGHGVEV